jgi:hypothetical protein
MLHLLDEQIACDDHASRMTAPRQAVDQSRAEKDPRAESDAAGNSSDRDHGRVTRTRTRTDDTWEVKVTSVLPFVAVGVLSRLGYCDVVATSLHAAKCAADLPCFGAALAYKMLPGPHRGWLRDEADQRTAAAVAGLPERLSGAAIDQLAYRCAGDLSPADGFLQLLLAEGHDPSQAMLIDRPVIAGRPLWLLLDSQGSFAIGWFPSREALERALDDFVGSLVLLTDAAAEPSLLAALAARHRFMTQLPPSRGERWRPVDRQRTLWTNDCDSSTTTLLRQSQCFRNAAASAERVTHAFLEDRPLVPGTLTTSTQHLRERSLIQLDRSLALAAASALGVIAWQLWGSRESTDPLLAIERLGDLDGRVSIGQDRITVRPALGRRYQDLYRHNFLADVANLPWLGGRRVEFAGL